MTELTRYVFCPFSMSSPGGPFTCYGNRCKAWADNPIHKEVGFCLLIPIETKVRISTLEDHKKI